MLTAIQSVLAIVIVVGFGFFAGKKNIISKDLSHVFSTLVMTFTFPAVLFTSVACTPISDLVNFKFLTVFFFGLMGIYFLVFFFCNKILKRNKQVSAMTAFACSFPNMAFMGIPYLTEVLGSGSVISVAIGNVITSVFMIPITMIYLEQRKNDKKIFKNEFIKLFKKPLIISPILGILVAFLHIPIPHFIMNGLHILGAATSPIALFGLGLMILKFKFTLSKDAIIITILKVAVQPFIVIGLILTFNLNGLFAKEIIILTAMPTAVIVSMFAEKYDIYRKETVSAIIGSSIISIVTLVLFTSISGIF
jgi:malonate transporter and related proteins